MEAKQKIVLTVAILIVLVVVFYYVTMGITKYTGKVITGNVISDSSKGDFAKCLADAGVKMYGAYWCGHCQNQKSLFGQDVLESSGVYVECDPNGQNSQTDLCLAKGIEGYPTWEINGQLYPGEQTFDKLAELSGCKIV